MRRNHAKKSSNPVYDCDIKAEPSSAIRSKLPEHGCKFKMGVHGKTGAELLTAFESAPGKHRKFKMGVHGKTAKPGFSLQAAQQAETENAGAAPALLAYYLAATT